MRSWILLGLFSLVSANPCTDPSSTREQFIEGGCCLPDRPKSLSSGDCSDMDVMPCSGIAYGGITGISCTYNSNTDACEGGAADFTQISIDGTNPVSNPCEYVSVDECESYVGCKMNEVTGLCMQVFC